MATRTFADISKYGNPNPNRLSPLDALLNGAQQGLELQQLPGKLQDQALARQLNNALTQQKLYDLQNPEAALARKLTQELTLKGALNPSLGIQQAEPGLVGQTIFNPGAITPEQQAALPSEDLLAMRQTALDQGGVSIPTQLPTATAGLPETPISAFGIQTGLTSNPNTPIQAAGDKLDRQIQLANSRVRSSGVKGQFIPDGLGGMIFAQKPTSAGGEVQTTRVQTPEGENVKVTPKVAAADRGLTANARVDLAMKSGEQGLKPEDVESVITTPEAKSAYEAGLRKRNDVARMIGVKDLSKAAAKTLDGVEKFQPTFDLLRNRFQSLVDQNLVGLIPGNWAQFKNYVSGSAANPELKAYQDELQAFTGQLKAFTNDTGVMTDQDQARISKALGDITKDPRVAIEKLNDIQEIVDRNGTRAADFLDGKLTLEDIASEFRSRASNRKTTTNNTEVKKPDSSVVERLRQTHKVK